MIIKRFLGIFTGIMCLTAFILAFSEEQSAVFVVTAIFFGIITFLLFRTTAKDKEKANQIIKKRQDKLRICTAQHVNGLPLAENAACIIESFPDKFSFSSGKATFDLDKNKITDMCIKTDNELQQQYVSSIGGAVGGAMLFGPLGAIIGGRSKKKTVSRKTISYLIITYESDNTIKYIGFDVSSSIASAIMFVNEYKSNSNLNNIKISL